MDEILLEIILTLVCLIMIGVYFGYRRIQHLRMQAEKAADELRSKTAFLQNVINALPAMIGYWDADLVNRLSNEVYSQYFKLRPFEILGQHISELLPHDVYEKNKPFIEGALKGNFQEFERELTDVNGHRRLVLAQYIPDKKDNVVVGFFVFVVDITELRALELENRQKQAQLFEKSRLSLLGEMAAGVAHEINNPLMIITGKLHMTKSQIESMQIDEQQKLKILEAMQIVNMTADRISAIVSALRAFSRDTEGAPYQDVTLQKILTDVFSLTRELAHKKGISLDVDFENANLSINCNEVQIGQVLMNFISNSIDAISDLPEKWIKISVSTLGSFAQIQVTDSGQGIPTSVADKMMQPFFTTKEIGKGTGLGLSISKGIIEKHKGSLTYETVNGHTSFKILVPMAPGRP